MDESWLNAGAILLELGLPVALLAAYARFPKLRAKVVVILGSITPFIAAYIWTTGRFLAARDEYHFGFLVMWVFSAGVYALCAVVGALLSFLPFPRRSGVRFGMGVAATLAIVTPLLWGP